MKNTAFATICLDLVATFLAIVVICQAHELNIFNAQHLDDVERIKHAENGLTKDDLQKVIDSYNSGQSLCFGTGTINAKGKSLCFYHDKKDVPSDKVFCHNVTAEELTEKIQKNSWILVSPKE